VDPQRGHMVIAATSRSYSARRTESARRLRRDRD
jgi:hypothetical protein